MIKHYRFDKRYLCNQAVKPTQEKFAKTKEEVTCKNCIKSMHKYNIESKTKETTQLDKLQKDYREYQKAQAMSSILSIMGWLVIALGIITPQIYISMILSAIGSIVLGIGIGIKLKTIRKVFNK